MTGVDITDDQIRELRDYAIRSGNTDLVADCQIALYDIHTIEAYESAKAKARTRCAEIFSARKVQP